MNTYALFAETFRVSIGLHGRAGVIVPTGIATDDSTKAFFGSLVVHKVLSNLTGWENEGMIFPTVHHFTKFCLLTMTGENMPVSAIRMMFNCRYVDQMNDIARQFRITPEEIMMLNPNTRTCPIFRTGADAELTKSIYRRVPVLVDERAGENPWEIQFLAMFHMSSDSSLFAETPSPGLLPLYEAKLLHQFDHRWATYTGEDARDLTAAEKADPRFTVTPRYWVPCDEGEKRLVDKGWNPNWLLGFRDITNATNERTAIFSLLPRVAVGHTAPQVMLSFSDPHQVLCLLANMNALVFDYVTRQKLGGTHLTYGYLRQLPVLSPNHYTALDREYIVPRVLELVYTAWDMQSFARDLGYEGEPFPFDRDVPDPFAGTPGAMVSRRALLRAELDAYYARLYGLTRKQLRYILDPYLLTDHELQDILDPTEDPPDVPRTKDFPGETFRVLKDRELREYGEYRTARLVLGAWDSL